jgi:hypothetical protein
VRAAVAVVALSLAGCATFPVAGDEGGKPWLQVSTPHFSLATDMDQRPAEELASILEDWCAAMTVALTAVTRVNATASGKEEPLLVIALRSKGEREMAHYRLGGAFMAFPLVPPAVSIGNIDEEQGREVVKHELAHALLHSRLPRVPRWLTEGVAVYLQTAEIDRKRGTAHWGISNNPEARNWTDYSSSVSASGLLDPERWNRGEDGAMEVRAGLLVGMLIERYPGQLACYMQRLETDLDPEGALECFPGRGSWDYEVTEYGYSLSFADNATPFQAPRMGVQAAPMKDARVHAVLALLDFMVLLTIEERFRPPRMERGRKNLERALALDPDDLLAGLLYMSRAGADDSRWDGVTRAMVAHHPDDWRAWVWRARTPHIAPAEWKDATERASELAPNEAEVLRLTAVAALSEQRWGDAREAAIKAWLGGASDNAVRATLFIATAQLGRCPEALKWSRSPSETDALNDELLKIQTRLGLTQQACPVGASDLQ